MVIKKKVAKKATVKRAPAKKVVARRKPKAGDTYACEVCGLAVVVDEDCGCAEAHGIICCSEPMKEKPAGR
jgi:hypothetical protein